MSNLLLEDDKKSVRRDYLIRLFAASLLLLSVSAGIGSILLLPSFFLIESKKQALLGQTAIEKLGVSNDEHPRKIIRDAEKKIELLADIGNQEKVGTLLTSLLKEKPSGIILTSITYTRGAEGGSFIVSGTAASRSILVGFSNAIGRNSRFAEVQLPVSNLAGNRDILFSLSFKVIPFMVNAVEP